MNINSITRFIITLLALFILHTSCTQTRKKFSLNNFHYETFRDSLRNENKKDINDSSNIFDSKDYTPGIDSLDTLLIKMDTVWHKDIAMMERMDTLLNLLKNKNTLSDLDKERMYENIRVLDSFLLHKRSLSNSDCRGIDCPLYAVVAKSTQMLYLYLEGELKDSFKVSTGMKKYKTPDIEASPSGPILMKYTSRKFPGGNYKGMGNMPFAVFIKGGYAIHGTTPGNFTKLGSVASHGCIRLHPENARIFYELVKLYDLNNTWVSVRDSL